MPAEAYNLPAFFIAPPHRWDRAFLRKSQHDGRRQACYTVGMPRLVSFLSDFGLKDGYVAQVKARIMSEIPNLTIVDITHSLDAFDILSGAWLLFTTAETFPEGTIHLAVVYPGVGTPRRALIVEKAGHLFVGPDNGIFSFLYPADSVVNVTWRPHGAIAPSFHGRDLFAPIAIRLLTGTTPLELGHAMNDPVSLDITSPQVVHIDRYGNIVTNITPGQLQDHALVLHGHVIRNLVTTFGDLSQDDLGLIVGSAGTIEIVARQAHAASRLGARVGMPVSLRQDA